MALIFCDGFDSYTGTADFAQKGWWLPNGSTDVFWESTGGFSGGGAFSIDNWSSSSAFAAYMRRGFPKVAATDDIYAAFWFNPTLLSTNRNFFSFGADSAFTSAGQIHHIALINNPTDGSIDIYRAGSTLNETTATGVLTAATWHFICVRLRARNSPNGEYDLWVDGNLVAGDTGIDMVNNLSVEGTNFCGFAGGNGTKYYFDDILIWDSTGAGDFTAEIDPIRIDTIRPDGAGSASTSTVTGAASNWQGVNSADPDGSSVYTSFNATGQDLFTADDVPTTASRAGTPSKTYGVVINAIQGRSSTTTAQTIRPLVRSGGTTGTGTTAATGAAFSGTELDMRQELFAQDPATVAEWEYADLDSIEIGVERVA